MKSAKILIPIIAISAIIAIAFALQPSVSTGEIVSSEDGSAEVVAFFEALSENNFAHATNYVQRDCPAEDDYCMFENLAAGDITKELRSLCQDNMCDMIEIDEVGEDVGSGVRSHKIAFIDANGDRVAFCSDVDCRVKKLTMRVRTAFVDGVHYVVDAPPIRIDQ